MSAGAVPVRTRFVESIVAANLAGWSLLTSDARGSTWEDIESAQRREADLHKALALHRRMTGQRYVTDGLENYLRSFKRSLHEILGSLLDPHPRGSAPLPRLLDVGCGVGEDVRALASERESGGWVGCDVAIDQLQGVGDTRWNRVQATLYNLPVATGTFDVVLASEVLEHLSTPVRALREWQRVLGNGGVLVITCPNGAVPFLERLLFAAVRLLFGREANTALVEAQTVAGGFGREEHFHEYTPAELRMLLRLTGYRILDHRIEVPRVPDALYGRFRNSPRWRRSILRILRFPWPRAFGATQILCACRADAPPIEFRSGSWTFS